MHGGTKFLFERCFEAPLPEPEEPGPGAEMACDEEPEAGPAREAEDGPAVNLVSEEELARAREQALAAGREQGAAEAVRTIEQRTAAILDTVAERIAEMFDADQAAETRACRQATAIAVAIVGKLFPALNRRHGLSEIEHLVETAMDRVFDAPKLTVRVSQELCDPLAERIAAIAESHAFSSEITVVADSSLGEGDCRIEWVGGGAVRETAALWREIDGIIERALGSEDPPSPDAEPEQPTAGEAPRATAASA